MSIRSTTKSDKESQGKQRDKRDEPDESREQDSAEEASADAVWRHKRIRLESLNPGYPSWDLDPDEDKYRIVAEFVRVLE